MKKKWSEFELNFLQKNYQISGSTNIAFFFKRSKKSIEQKAFKLKLKLTNNFKSKQLSNGHLKDIKEYQVNNIFDLENIKDIYFLGYLWADGYLNKNSFGIEANENDMNELYKHITHMGKWSTYKRKRVNWKPQIDIRATNPHIVKWLINYGYDKKSYISPNKIISCIPKNKQKYFILGIIDGDGCFYYNKKQYLSQLVISSTYDQDWSYIESFYSERNIRYTIKRIINKNRKYSIIRITNRNDIINLGSELYESYDKTNIGLLRKYSKFLEIKKVWLLSHTF